MPTVQLTNLNGKQFTVQTPDPATPAAANAGTASGQSKTVKEAAKKFADEYFKGTIVSPEFTLISIFTNVGTKLNATIDALRTYAKTTNAQRPMITLKELEDFDRVAKIYVGETNSIILGMAKLVEVNKERLQEKDHSAYCDAFIAIHKSMPPPASRETGIESFIEFFTAQGRLISAQNLTLVSELIAVAKDEVPLAFDALRTLKNINGQFLKVAEITQYQRCAANYANMGSKKVGIPMGVLANLVALAGNRHPDNVTNADKAICEVITPVKNGISAVEKLGAYSKTRKAIPADDEIKVITESAQYFEDGASAFIGVLDKLTGQKTSLLHIDEVKALKVLAENCGQYAAACLDSYASLVTSEVFSISATTPKEFIDTIKHVALSKRKKAFLSLLGKLAKAKATDTPQAKYFLGSQLKGIAEVISNGLLHLDENSAVHFDELCTALVIPTKTLPLIPRLVTQLPSTNEIRTYIGHVAAIIESAHDKSTTLTALSNYVKNRSHRTSILDLQELTPVLVRRDGMGYMPSKMLLGAELFHGRQFQPNDLALVAENCIVHAPTNDKKMNPFDSFPKALRDFFDNNDPNSPKSKVQVAASGTASSKKQFTTIELFGLAFQIGNSLGYDQLGDAIVNVA